MSSAGDQSVLEFPPSYSQILKTEQSYGFLKKTFYARQNQTQITYSQICGKQSQYSEVNLLTGVMDIEAWLGVQFENVAFIHYHFLISLIRLNPVALVYICISKLFQILFQISDLKLRQFLFGFEIRTDSSLYATKSGHHSVSRSLFVPSIACAVGLEVGWN